MKQKLVSLLIALLATVGMAFAQAVGPVSCYGKLMVNASTGQIYGEKTGATKPVQVKGVSFGWNMYPESSPYFNANMVGAMVDNMKAEIVRAPMGTKSDQWGNKGYDQNASNLTTMNNTVIQAAINKGVYVIIDWHSHQAETEETNAITYFRDMAQKWGGYDNVIFEIYNEPLAQDWNTIYNYAVKVIAEIRKYSNNLILVGTQGYSQMVGAPADKKINDPNVAYVLHFYAYSHQMNTYTAYGNSQFQTQITKALNAKLPIFVSEWGTTHSDGGQQSNNNFNTHSASNSDTWMKWCDDNKISWCAWEISNKTGAKSAWFEASKKSATSTTIAKTDLNESGQYIWDRLASHATTAAWRQTGGCAACTEVNVTFNYNYSGAPAATVSKNCQGSPAVKPSNPTRTGYKFLGWSLNSAAGSAIYPFTASLTGAITLYAQWEQGAGPTLVFDGEKGNATYLCTTWFGFDDGKGSLITTAKDKDNNLPVATTGGANVGTKPNGGHITVNYSTVASTVTGSWGIGFGFNLSKETTKDLDVPVDLTGITSITFYQKSPAAKIQLKVKGVNVNFEVELAASTSAWIKRDILIEDFVIPSWATLAANGIAGGTKLSATHIKNICAIQFQVNNGTSATTNTIAIDHIELQGIDLPLCEDVPELTPYDKLQILIVQAETLQKNTEVGNNPCQAPQSAKTDFATAISTAKTVSSTATTTTIELATLALEASISTFRSKINPCSNNTLIADCEEGNKTKLQTFWSSYADGNGTTGITIAPLSDATNPFTMATGGASGTAHCANAKGFLPATVEATAPNWDNGKYPSAGISFPMKEPGTSNLPYDLTGATGIGFWHKGDELTFVVMTTNITPNKGWDFSVLVPASKTAWQYVVVNFPSAVSESPVATYKELALTQPSWVSGQTGYTPAMGVFEPSMVYKLQWQVKDGAARNYDFFIDEVSVLGKVIDIQIVDTKALDDLIASATTLHGNATEGTAVGNYAVGSKATLLTAINAAKAVSDAKKDQATVNAAVVTLQAAVDAFNAAKIGSNESTIIADCEDGNKTKLLTYWSSYISGKGTTIVPLSSPTAEFTMTAGGANGTANAASVTGKLDCPAQVCPKGTDFEYASAGISFPFEEPGDANLPYDLTGATGIGFWHKGDAIFFQVMTTNITPNGGFDYEAAIPASPSAWQYVIVNFPGETSKKPVNVTVTPVTKSLAQTCTWSPAEYGKPFLPEAAYKLQWQVKDGVARNYSFAIDEVTVLGKKIEFPTPPEPKGLILDWNQYASSSPKIEYQGKYTPAAFAGYVPKVGDKVTVTVAGKATEAINNFKIAIIDDREEICWWGEYSAVKTIGNVAKGAAIYETISLTIDNITQTAANACTGLPLSNPKLVFIGENATLAATGTEGIGTGTKIVITDETITVSIDPYVPGKNELCYDSDAGLNQGKFPILAFDKPVKAGDVVKVNIAGVMSQGNNFEILIVDVTETGGYWNELSDWGVATFSATPGVRFEEEFLIPIIAEPIGSGKGSQSIVLMDWASMLGGALCTEFIAEKFTAEVLSAPLNKTALQNAINEAKSLLATEKSCETGGGNYPATAISALQGALSNAEPAMSATTQGAIDQAAGDLNTAISTFKTTKITKPDKTALNTAITTAKGRLVGAVEGTADGQYATGSIKKLEDAIAVAEGVYNDGCVLSVTNATSTLTTAISDFDNAKNTLNKQPLEDAIALATPKAADANSCAATPTAGDYPAAAVADMKKALADAQGVLATATTQAQITAAVTALNNAVSTFEATKIAKPDKTALNNAITAATNKYNAAKDDCITNGCYEAGSRAKFDAAIKVAQGVASSGCALTADVTKAVSDLAVAEKAFDDARIDINKSALKTAIDEATQLRSDNAGNIGDGNGQYPATADKALEDAIGIANNEYNSTTSTTTTVAQATKDLNDAIKAFKESAKVVNKAALKTAIDEATGLRDANLNNQGDGDGQYPTAAMNKLKDAITAANLVYSNAGASQDKVDAEVTALKKAIDDFEKSINSVDKSKLDAAITAAEAAIKGKVKGDGDGQYSAAVYEALDEALKAAKTAQTKPGVAQSEIDDKTKALTDAIADFIPNTVDKGELQAVISAMQVIYDAAKTDGGNGHFSSSAKAALGAALTAAKGVNTDPGASQAKVDKAIVDLEAAEAAMQLTKVTTDKAALAAAITAAEELAKATVGTEAGEYPPTAMSLLSAAIASAKEVNKEEDEPQSTIDTETANLKTAMSEFEAAVIPLNTSALTQAIAAAKATQTSTTVGDGTGEYPAAAAATFAAAIAAAEQALKDVKTNAGIKAAADVLNKARQDYIESVNGIDTTPLQDAITAAQDKLDKATKGDNDGEYNAAAVKDLQDAIDAAADALAAAATQKEVVDAIKDLEKALDAFKPNVIVVVVDKSALEQAIAKADEAMKGAVKGDGDGEYPAAVYNALQQALTSAKTIFGTAGVTQQQVNDRTDALTAALDKFVPNTTGTAALEQAIADAEEALEGAVKGDGDGQYPAGVYNALKTALDNAITTLGKPGVTQAEVDNRTGALVAALKNFVPNKVDKSALQALFNKAKPIFDAAVEGNGDGQFSSDVYSALKTALDNADETLKDAGAPQSVVDNRKTALDAAFTKFKPNVVSKEALEQAIIDAQELHDAANDQCAASGCYEAGSKATFQTAIDAANAVAQKPGASANEIANAIDDLKTATGVFESKKNDVDLSGLIALIAKAQGDYNAAKPKEGTGDGFYLTETLETFDKAIKAAQAVVDNPATTKGDVTSAISKLQAAINAFKPEKVDKTLLAAQLAVTKPKFTGNKFGTASGEYPAAIGAALDAAIKTAEAVIAEPQSTQKDVNDALAALKAADTDFNNSEEKPYVDKTKLEKALTDANNLYNEGKDKPGTGNGFYLQSKIDAFKDAIKAADDVVKNDDATQAIVDKAVTDLNTAIGNFTPEVVTKVDLKAEIDRANGKYISVEYGTEDGQKPEAIGNELKQAIADADAVYKAAQATQTEVNAALAKLTTAVTNWDNTDVIRIEKDALKAKLDEANGKYNSVQYGNADGEKPVAIGNELQAAITAAQGVYDNPGATQDQVDAALKALNTAVSNWDATKPISKKPLADLVKSANAQLNGAKEGVDYGEYKAGAIAALTEAVGYAEAELTATTANQARIDAEYEELTKAIAAFNAAKLLVDKQYLTAEIAKAEKAVKDNEENIGESNGQYLQSCMDALKKAVADAKGVYNSTSVTDQQVANATQTMNSALVAFAGCQVVVDKYALQQALNDANNTIGAAKVGECDGEYPSTGDYQLVISAAQKVYGNSAATNNDVANALNALKDAKEKFAKSVNKVDATKLNQAIFDAGAALSKAGSNINCAYDGCYPETTKQALDSKLAAANDLKKSALCPTQVNKVLEELELAIDAFNKSRVTVNKAALAALVEEARDLRDVTTIGTGNGQCPDENAKAAFSKAIADASNVNTNPQASQADVNAAYEALSKAYDEFKAKIVTFEIPEIKYLQAKIEEASTWYSTTKEEKDGGIYKDGSKAILYAAMVEARAVRDAAEVGKATQAEVDAATAKLGTAINDFLNSVNKLNKDPLKDAINEAEKELRQAKIGDEVGQYPQEAAEALTEAINIAKAVLATATTQPELTEARANLIDAIQTFRDSINIGEFDARKLDRLITTVQTTVDNSEIYSEINNSCNGDGYPVSAYTQINMRLNAAKKARTKALTQDDIDEIYDDLSAAYEVYLTSWTICTGIDEVEASTMRVYPTMATASITVSAEKTIRSIAIVSLSGTTVAFETPNSAQATIDVAKFAQGTYMVVVTFNDNSVEKQTIIKK